MNKRLMAFALILASSSAAMASLNTRETTAQINQKVTIVHVGELRPALPIDKVLEQSHVAINSDDFKRFSGESCWIAQGLRVSKEYAQQSLVSKLYEKGKQPNNPFGGSPEDILQKVAASTFELIAVAPRLNEKEPTLRLVYDMGSSEGDEVDYDMGFGIDVVLVYRIEKTDEQAFIKDINKLDGRADTALKFTEHWLQRSKLDGIRYACAAHKSRNSDDWVWYELALEKGKQPRFKDISVPQVSGEPVNLGIVSYISRDNQMVDVTNMTVRQSELEAITCAQCHTRNTAFHQWQQRHELDQTLATLPIESPFVHLTRNFSYDQLPTIKSRYQISFELYQLHLLQSLSVN